MKKLFAIVAIAGALTACNNSSDSTTSTDSTTTVDTTTMAPMDTTTVAPMDTTGAMSDTSKMSADTTKK